MHDDEANVANCKKVLHKNSLNFTKTPLKFSSISLIAEKKYGNYESGIYTNETIFYIGSVLSKYFRVLSDIGLTEFYILSDRTKFCRTKLFIKPIVKLCSVLFSIT